MRPGYFKHLIVQRTYPLDVRLEQIALQFHYRLVRMSLIELAARNVARLRPHDLARRGVRGKLHDCLGELARVSWGDIHAETIRLHLRAELGALPVLIMGMPAAR